LQYNGEIDNIIINELSMNEFISFLELKKRVERSLSRTLSFQTYSDHLKKMIKDKILNKKDTYERGKPVFYSLSDDAKRQRQLNLLGVSPKQILFRNIYEKIFFYEIYHTPLKVIGSEQELDRFLSEINMTRADLKEIHSNNHKLEIAIKYEQKRYADTDTLYYTGDSDIHITRTEYWEACKYYKNKYATEYTCTLPGISLKEFLGNPFMGVRFESANVEETLSLLIKNGLIKPGIIFRGDMRYMIADRDLRYLIHALSHILYREGEWLKHKWNYFEEPTREEQERMNWLLGQQKAANIFRDAELSRYENKRKIKERSHNKGIIEYRNNLEKTLKEKESELNDAIKEVKENYNETIKKYGFLHDVLRIICPMVLK
jgi:hypothetical protein